MIFYWFQLIRQGNVFCRIAFFSFLCLLGSAFLGGAKIEVCVRKESSILVSMELVVGEDGGLFPVFS